MYSSSPYYDCYGNFEELLKQEFRKQGIEPVFDKFYLDFNTVAPEEGIICLIYHPSPPAFLCPRSSLQCTFSR